MNNASMETRRRRTGNDPRGPHPFPSPPALWGRGQGEGEKRDAQRVFRRSPCVRLHFSMSCLILAVGRGFGTIPAVRRFPFSKLAKNPWPTRVIGRYSPSSLLEETSLTGELVRAKFVAEGYRAYLHALARMRLHHGQ